MNSLVQRVQQNAAVIAGAIVATLNIVAVTGVWNPTGTALAAINAAVAAVLAFLVQTVPSLRSRRLRRGYAARAREESRELVPTAGAIIDEVVGRDELCKVLMADLRDRRTRPHVLVGGVGTGKTAVLVRLTEFLADEGAVPVPVRLRDSGRSWISRTWRGSAS
jgi:hypothetical protein